jgi:transposase-like protein
MSRRSPIAHRVDRAEIERDLAIGIPIRRLAAKYGLDKSTLHRWRKRLPPQLRAAMLAQSLRPGVDLEKLRVTESEGLLVHLAAQRAKLLLMQDAAASAEQYQVASAIAAQVHRNLEIVGKYLGEFAQHHVSTSVSVLISAEYLELRSTLLRALQPFPEARAAVVDAIHRLETKVAKQTSPPVLEALPAPEVAP